MHGSLGFIKYLIHLLVYWPLYLPSSLKIGYINQNQISNHWTHQSKPARKSPKPPSASRSPKPLNRRHRHQAPKPPRSPKPLNQAVKSPSVSKASESFRSPNPLKSSSFSSSLSSGSKAFKSSSSSSSSLVFVHVVKFHYQALQIRLKSRLKILENRHRHVPILRASQHF